MWCGHRARAPRACYNFCMPDDTGVPANTNLVVASALPAPHDDAIVSSHAAASDAGDASAAPVAALANDLAYTLTVGQARELFAQHGRKCRPNARCKTIALREPSRRRRFERRTVPNG